MTLAHETADESTKGKLGTLVPHPSSAKAIEKAEADRAAKAAKGKKPKAETAEPEQKLLTFDGVADAATQIVKALDSEDRARANRRKIGEEFRDSIKQGQDRLDTVISEARSSKLKDAGLDIQKAVEAAAKARSKVKDARAAFAEMASEDDGPIGKAFTKLENLKQKRAEAKSSAAERVEKAAARAELVRTSIREAASQLKLAL